jgi:chromosome segregation ATPase
MTGSNEFRGTYIHRKLIAHIASWISPSFALKVSDIVEEYLLIEEKEKHAVIIKQKDDKIDELKIMIKELKEDTEKILEHNEDLTDKMSKLSLDNEITHDQLNEVQHTLDIVVEDRVPLPADESVTNTIVIYEVEKDANKFHIFRVQKRGFRAALSRYLKKSPNAVKFMEIEYNPNAINYYYRFKQEYKEKIISRYNDFELINTSKEQLKEFIEKVDDEKFDVDNIQ